MDEPFKQAPQRRDGSLEPDAARQCVNWRMHGQVAVVTINNPPLNILTKEVKREIGECFDELRGIDAVRAVIVTGAGERAFSAGANIKEFPERIQQGNAYQISRQGHELSRKVSGFPRPTIAAVNGVAFGGGCELLLFCDFRIASERARFAFPEILRGVFPGTSGTQRLVRLVGRARAKELLLLGEPIDAQEAYRMGLITRVVAHEDLMSEAMSWAAKLAARPGVAVEAIKRLVDEAAELPLEQGLEQEAAMFARVFQTADVREGVAAFFEKREPKFQHR